MSVAGAHDRPGPAKMLPALTGLRFFAAMLVVSLHAEIAETPLAPEWLRGIATNGAVGVGVFFVLSGFVLAQNYSARRVADETGIGDFRVARFARIYPVYLLGLLVTIPIFLEQTASAPAWEKATAAISVLGLFQAWIPTFALLWNFPSWSLSAEAFFYWAFPSIRRRTSSLGPGAAAAQVLAAWIVGAIPVVAVLASDTLLEWRTAQLVVHYHPLMRLPEFFAGVALHRVYETLGPRQRSSRVGAWLSVTGAATLLATLAWSTTIRNPAIDAAPLLVPPIAALVLGLAIGGGPIAWLLSRPSIRMLGEASYALYILHVPVLRAMADASASLGLPGPHTAVFAVAGSLAAIMAAIVTFFVLEQPARRWIRARLASR